MLSLPDGRKMLRLECAIRNSRQLFLGFFVAEQEMGAVKQWMGWKVIFLATNGAHNEYLSFYVHAFVTWQSMQNFSKCEAHSAEITCNLHRCNRSHNNDNNESVNVAALLQFADVWQNTWAHPWVVRVQNTKILPIWPYIALIMHMHTLKGKLSEPNSSRAYFIIIITIACYRLGNDMQFTERGWWLLF